MGVEIYRKPDGTFAKGTVANPKGRPKREIEAATLAALADVWTPEQVQDVAKALLSRAKAGDVSAAKLVLEYQAGKPTEHISINDDERADIVLHLPSLAEGDKPALQSGENEKPHNDAKNGA